VLLLCCCLGFTALSCWYYRKGKQPPLASFDEEDPAKQPPEKPEAMSARAANDANDAKYAEAAVADAARAAAAEEIARFEQQAAIYHRGSSLYQMPDDQKARIRTAYPWSPRQQHEGDTPQRPIAPSPWEAQPQTSRRWAPPPPAPPTPAERVARGGGSGDYMAWPGGVAGPSDGPSAGAALGYNQSLVQSLVEAGGDDPPTPRIAATKRPQLLDLPDFDDEPQALLELPESNEPPEHDPVYFSADV